MILLDVGYDHPAVSRVTQTCSADRQRTVTMMKTLVELVPHSAFLINTAKLFAVFQSMASIFDSLNKVTLIQVCLSTEAEENKLLGQMGGDLVEQSIQTVSCSFQHPKIILRL